MNSCPYSSKLCVRRPENRNNCKDCLRAESNFLRILNNANNYYDSLQKNDKNKKLK